MEGDCACTNKGIIFPSEADLATCTAKGIVCQHQKPLLSPRYGIVPHGTS